MKLLRWVIHRTPYLVLVVGMVVGFALRAHDTHEQSRRDRRIAAAGAAAVKAVALHVDAATRAQNRRALRATKIAFCQVINKTRAEDRAKWEYLLHLAPPPPAGSTQRKEEDAFVAFLVLSDAPSHCDP